MPTIHPLTTCRLCILFSVSVWCCVLSGQSRQEIWQWWLCSSGDRPEGINHECQPLTLSVWSLGHTLAWWSLSGNELLEAACIIHTYKSTVCFLFLEMRLNEGWPYLGSVLLMCHWVVLMSPHYWWLICPFKAKPAIWLVDLSVKVVFRSYKSNCGSDKASKWATDLSGGQLLPQAYIFESGVIILN